MGPQVPCESPAKDRVKAHYKWSYYTTEDKHVLPELNLAMYTNVGYHIGPVVHE